MEDKNCGILELCGEPTKFLRKIGWFNRVGFRKVTEQYNENTLQQWKWKIYIHILYSSEIYYNNSDCFFSILFSIFVMVVLLFRVITLTKKHEENEEKHNNKNVGNNNMLTYSERESYFPSRLIPLSSSPIL